MASRIDIDDVALDFSQGSDSIDLVDMPLGVEILRLVSLELRDEALNTQFQSEMLSFAELVDNSIKNDGVGYLMKVELYVDQHGTPSIPSGQLIFPIGIGREPIDSYAEFLNRDSIRGPQGQGIDTSNYVWIRRGNNGLRAVSLRRAENESFLRSARSEAQRRRLIGDPLGQDASGYLQMRRAIVWAEMARARAGDIAEQSKRDQVDTLTKTFIAAEGRFNDAFRAYQLTLRDAARKNEHMKVLNGIETALDVIKVGIQVGKLYSTTDTPVNSDGQPVADLSEEATKTQQRLDDLRNRLMDDVPRVNNLGQNLKGIEVEIRTIYEQGGVPLPQFEPLRNSDVTVELP